MPQSLFIGLCVGLLLAVIGVTTFFWRGKPRLGIIILGFLATIAVTVFVGWKPVYKTRTPRFAESVKSVADPAELQQWAVAILRDTPADSPPEIPNDKVPANIRNLTSDGSPFQEAFCDTGSAQDRTVWLAWGGGFGHWGLRVGTPLFRVSSDDSNYYIEWKPGVYFWHQTR